jgi:hypothetical protein
LVTHGRGREREVHNEHRVALTVRQNEKVTTHTHTHTQTWHKPPSRHAVWVQHTAAKELTVCPTCMLMVGVDLSHAR